MKGKPKLELIKLSISENLIRNKIDFLKDALLDSDQDYIYELLQLCQIYLQHFYEDEHLDNVQYCIDQAMFHYLNYCIQNEIDRDA